MRQRVSQEDAGGLLWAVSRRQGTPLMAAASDRRRDGVRSADCRIPMTRSGAWERRPSSSTHKVSVSRRVSAIRTASGGSPSAARPGPCKRPCSAATAEVAHHKINGAPGRLACRFSPTSRRTARRSPKTRAAGQSPAAAGFNSCTAASARPCPGRRASSAASPKDQAAADNNGKREGAAATPARVADPAKEGLSAAPFAADSRSRPGATSRAASPPGRRSRSRIRDRSSARRDWRLSASGVFGFWAGRSGGGTRAKLAGRLSTPPVRSTVRDTELTPGH